jgi:transposase-like protein
MHLNKMSFRGIAQVLEFSPSTVRNWIKEAAQKQTPDRPEQNEPVDAIEIDEQHTFFKKRGQTLDLAGR